ncbi:MAG: hypothetical protein Q4C95_01600 [Planctomycetia bacterium]|nr:hypothetical protein [Planctomycetia bacterium]
MSNEYFANHFKRISCFILFLLALCFPTGCKKDKVEFGSSQKANIKEQEEQNQNLIFQVVQATEELEKHPDPTFLRNAVGRLNSWLQKKQKSKDFQIDPDLKILEEKIRELSNQLYQADKLYALFLENSQEKPTEQNGEELILLLDSIKKSCEELAQTIGGSILHNYAVLISDLAEKLNKTKEFQFGDRVSMLQTAIRQFELQPWFQFNSYAQGLDHFANLLKLEGRVFLPEDADYLKQVVWFRNIAHWAKGEKQGDLEIIQHLFNWTVENVSLTDPQTGLIGKVLQVPWETILLSHGTPLDRATVFMELLRQNRIDSFIIAPNSEDIPADFPLIVGVCLENEVYLFLPELGLPIPGPEGLSLNNGLTFNSIATLSEAAKNDDLLRKLDYSDEKKFPLTASQLQNVVAKVPTSPFLMSERMMIMEQEFSANVHTVLSISWQQQKERIAALENIQKVEHLWDGYLAILEQLIVPLESELLIQPYLYEMQETANLDTTTQNDKSESGLNNNDDPVKGPLRNTTSLKCPLWIGKILYFKGQFVGENSAAYWLQQGRVSDRLLKESMSHLEERTNMMITQIIEQNGQQGKSFSNEEIQEIARQYVTMEQQQHYFKVYMKVAARYYLALVSLNAGNVETALTHLEDYSLLEEMNQLWKPATLYLIARINESKGNYKNAVAIYRSFNDKFSYGNWLRGKWIDDLSNAQ